MKLAHSSFGCRRFSGGIAVLWALVLSHTVGLSSASQACIDAYSNMTSQSRVECDTDDLSLDQLKSEECPYACQALYDEVLANCNDGDVYIESLSSFEYEERTLFSSQGDKWASCNYGYKPSNCERAFNYMQELGDDFSDGACNTDGLSLDQLKSKECPSACQALYDEVLANCKDGDIYDGALPSSSLFDYAEDTLFLEEGHKWALCNFGYAPTECQRAYNYMDKLDFPCSSYGVSAEELETGECPALCQELYDNVVANCKPGVDNYLTSSFPAALTIYEEALLWNEEGERAQCDYGYDPTMCDVAVRDLYESIWLDGLFGAGTALCDPENNEASCTAECTEFIDGVVSACPVGAEFAPSAGHLQQTNRRIPFGGPESLDLLGLNPTTSFVDSFALSEKCWGYYIDASPPQSEFTEQMDSPTATTTTDDATTNSKMPSFSPINLATADTSAAVGMSVFSSFGLIWIFVAYPVLFVL